MSLEGQPVESEAELRMRFESELTAELVMKALQPDNEPLPSGLHITVKRAGSTLIFKVRSKRPIMSLLATLDDIISSTILVLRAAKAVERPSSPEG
ncbi:MAG TPA: hypothetical protein ENF79_02875 [Nitrososphaeria archaeon]|nr:hypothetical protein [Nitrososphaeria archaeon]